MSADTVLAVATPDIGELEARYVGEAVKSGWVSSAGPFVRRFERGFADFCEVAHATTTSNGTDALFLILKALGIGPGDEVIVPALTFAAVPAVVVHLGAVPVLVDIDPYNWCLDPQATEAAITDRTKAIIAVHSYGHPADMDALLALAEPKGIAVVEDAAEAHGARVRGRRVGGIGRAAAFSFYGNKVMTTGEGGAVTTADLELATRVEFLKNHAMDAGCRYFHSEAGYNCRMTNLQAALGCAQLERIDSLLASKAQTLDQYRNAWGDDSRLSFNPRETWAEPTVWMICAFLSADPTVGRDEIMARLGQEGIDTRPFFVPLAELPPYSACRVVGCAGHGSAPVSTSVSARGFNLPSGYGLAKVDIRRVTDALRTALK